MLPNQALKEDHQRCRKGLIHQIQFIQDLLSQGHPIRGRHDAESNLFQLIKLRGNDIPEMDGWISQQKRRVDQDC